MIFIFKKSCLTQPKPERKPAKCKDPLLYFQEEWCGRLKNGKAPWAICTMNIDKLSLKDLHEKCVSEMCALEGNETKQREAYCEMFEQIIEACYEFAKFLNSIWIIDWRNQIKCCT